MFTSYYNQNLFYRDMAKCYYNFSLPVKQTPHQVVTLRCEILICSGSCLIVQLEIISFYRSFYKDLLSLQTQK